ncbi:hypothetical protein HMPREF0294_0758 [Corynebacterium glucuronolyticum ATCC 51867]|uniref:Uncharacterized protein n=1 Tax=Corynebacterium glucuronolyticum ATCC 51866 TaxID=548478 RepID=A0ABP2DV32_9CORY|nr:hypothetical protein HMPREF0294_0758 [Corynebacterium glucuronolyticum ATCC 51867]EEI63842.1 hypothetical protein HMPREF0293_0638 [Corynebacterium glucuronolyticum ATCC 51866]
MQHTGRFPSSWWKEQLQRNIAVHKASAAGVKITTQATLISRRGLRIRLTTPIRHPRYA